MLTFELPIALPDHAAVLVSAVPYLGTIVFPAITADDLCREWTQAVMVPPFGFTDCHLRLHLFPLVRINDRRVALLRQVLCDPVERLALHEKRVDLPDDGRFLRDDLRQAIRPFAVTEERRIRHCDIFGNGAAIVITIQRFIDSLSGDLFTPQSKLLPTILRKVMQSSFLGS